MFHPLCVSLASNRQVTSCNNYNCTKRCPLSASVLPVVGPFQVDWPFWPQPGIESGLVVAQGRGRDRHRHRASEGSRGLDLAASAAVEVHRVAAPLCRQARWTAGTCRVAGPMSPHASASRRCRCRHCQPLWPSSC